VVVTEDNPKSKPWRSVVALCAAEVIRGEMFTGAVAVDVTFFMQRPKGHYGTGRNAGVMKPSAPPYPIVKPDLTKCWRPAEDALKGIAWADDSQVVIQRIRKVYGVPGAQINISEVVE
jgi:Holliday junction resolvase RusA-like endonuclease